MSKPAPRIVVTATGSLSAVGGNSAQTLAAINAGMVPFTEHEYYECKPEDPKWDANHPLYAAIVPTMDMLTDGHERFNGLIIPALTEVLKQAKLQRNAMARTGLYLALPKKDSAIAPLALDSLWLPSLLKRVGLSSLTNIHLEFSGDVGVFKNIQRAKQALQAGQIKQCIVGGVDSYLLRERIKLFDNLWRIKSGRTIDGFIPGEAACMLLLETEQHALGRGATPLAVIGEFAHAHEPEAITSDKNSTGQGLTEALRNVLVKTPKIHAVYCDLNGENYYAYEWGLILSRLAYAFSGEEKLYHPIETCGDVGAAIGGVLMLCAMQDLAKAPSGSAALLWSASDAGERCALTISSF